MYKLTRSEIRPKDLPNNSTRKVWTISIRVEADEEGADPNILVFQKNTWNAKVGDPFVDVASVHDLSFLPTSAEVMEVPGEHPVEDSVPYYRRNEVTLDCYTADEAEIEWLKINGRVRWLVKELRASCRLSKKEEVTYA